MSLREELAKVVAEVRENTKWFDHGSPDESSGDRFLRDYGQALVEAVDRAMRYEAVRKMNPPTFTKVYMHSVETSIPFDTLVDTWAFNNGYPSPLDTARSKTVDGGGVKQGWACSHCHGSGIGPDGKPCPVSHPINGDRE